MAQARELRRRIKSVQSTRQITRTMEMVSTSKLKRAQDRVVGARPYATALAEVLAELYAPEYAEAFPLLRQPEDGKIRRAGCGSIWRSTASSRRSRTSVLSSTARRKSSCPGAPASWKS